MADSAEGGEEGNGGGKLEEVSSENDGDPDYDDDMAASVTWAPLMLEELMYGMRCWQPSTWCRKGWTNYR